MNPIEVKGHCSERNINFRDLLNGRLFVYVNPVKYARYRGKVFIKLDKSHIQLLEDSNKNHTHCRQFIVRS